MNSAPAATTASSTPLMAPAPGFAARALLAAFGDMRRGCLRVELPDGTVREFGHPAAAPTLAPGVASSAALRVKRPVFFKKCLLYGDIGFAESYLDGDWDTPDLTALLGWFLLNLEDAPTLSGSRRAQASAVNLLRWVNRLGHLLRPNSPERARRNIAEHYDLSNDFFRLWLDDSMMYSAARFENATDSLAAAQTAKNEALCRKLRLTPDDHVLEIGTGWGGWSIHAARHHGCRVTSLTISRAQHDLAVQRIAAAGLADRIEVRLQDYRQVSGTYDKIVSIEMLEAVGHRYLPDFAATCHRALKPDGLLALQFIACADHRYDQLRRGVDFIQKHVFPGSLLLSVNRVNHQLSGQGGFVLHALEDMGRDYARTLRSWRENFSERLTDVRALGFDERFIRKWLYYLGYCEAAFAMRHISVVQTVHTRPNNLKL